jgi:carbon monoxide dehydrogenase subunit G
MQLIVICTLFRKGENTMFEFEKTILINRSPEEVFEFLTNPANEPKWRDSSISGEWTSDGPIGVGSTQHTVSKVLGREMETTSEVTVWDPPNEYGWKSVGGQMPFEATQKFESKEGGTQLTFSGQAEVGGFFKLAEGLVGKQLEKMMDKDMNGLKVYIEGSQV